MSITDRKSTNRKFIDNKISNVKRNNVANIYDDNKLTTNKHTYSRQLYMAFKYIYTICEKYSSESIFCLPIVYIHTASGISCMTIKKAINTLLLYNVIDLVGYSNNHSKFLECMYKYKNKQKFMTIISHGNSLYNDSYNKTDNKMIIHQLNNNTKASKKKLDEKRIRKAVNIMKDCPDLIIEFDKGNIYEDQFKQSFLLDCKFRASSHFANTKNPDNHDISEPIIERKNLIKQLEASTGYRYIEKDLPSSIYTLSHYLKTKELFFENNEYFYELIANEVKQKYNNTESYNRNSIEEKKLVKTICMQLYMGKEYNLVEDDTYNYKYKHNWTIKQYLKNDKNKQMLIKLLNYFTGHNSHYYTLDDFQQLFYYIQCAIRNKCIMKRSNIFLYETILCSIIIKMAHKNGYLVVNAYDGFYIPNVLNDCFIEDYVKPAYEQVYNIYYSNMNKPKKDKSNILLDYLKSNDKISYIDDRPYIKMLNDTLLVDYYKPGNIIYKTD